MLYGYIVDDRSGRWRYVYLQDGIGQIMIYCIWPSGKLVFGWQYDRSENE